MTPTKGGPVSLGRPEDLVDAEVILGLLARDGFAGTREVVGP